MHGAEAPVPPPRGADASVDGLFASKGTRLARRLLYFFLTTQLLQLAVLLLPVAGAWETTLHRLRHSGRVLLVMLTPGAPIMCAAAYFPDGLSVPPNAQERLLQRYLAAVCVGATACNAYTSAYTSWLDAEASPLESARFVRRAFGVLDTALCVVYTGVSLYRVDLMWPWTRIQCVWIGMSRLVGIALLRWLEAPKWYLIERLPLWSSVIVAIFWLALGASLGPALRHAIARAAEVSTIPLQLSELVSAPGGAAEPTSGPPTSGPPSCGTRSRTGSAAPPARAASVASSGSAGSLEELSMGRIEESRGRDAPSLMRRRPEAPRPTETEPHGDLSEAARARNEALWSTLRRSGISPHSVYSETDA